MKIVSLGIQVGTMMRHSILITLIFITMRCLAKLISTNLLRFSQSLCLEVWGKNHDRRLTPNSKATGYLLFANSVLERSGSAFYAQDSETEDCCQYL